MLLDQLVRFFTSVRVTVVCLVLAMLLVFFGTLAQEPLGLYAVQAKYFRSFFVDAGSFYAALHKFADMILQGFGHPLKPLDAHALAAVPWIPAFPGGYLIGGVLLINLFAAHFRYYKPGSRKIGIVFIHLGLVLLLVGQFATDTLSVESNLHLREGETRNYSEVDRRTELAVADVSDARIEKVVAIPQSVLAKAGEVKHPELPFTVRVKRFMQNSAVANRPPDAKEAPAAEQGIGPQALVQELPHVTELNKRDVPSALVEVVTPQGSLGTWLVSEYISQPQRFKAGDRAFEFTMRPRRDYTPHSLKLLDFRHDLYPGTQIPKNFSSRVELNNPKTGEKREVLIYMNNPLRYGGATYYQSGFDPDNEGTILQVVRNPSWLTPYLACVMVSAGLVIHFLMHLVQFLGKRRTT
jgi:hypothetical protein